MEHENLPILYSLHNCPYAIRARLAILKARQPVIIRSIKLDNKPSEMLSASPKGSVPVLVLPHNPESIAPQKIDDRSVIDESLDVMVWALKQNDPDNLLRSNASHDLPAMLDLIAQFERDFILAMNAFGCAKRYHETNMAEMRQACEVELAKLESRLSEHRFLFAEQESLVDIACVPFLRKFARIDKQWFRQSPYPHLRAWLNHYLQSLLFSKAMEQQELWLENRKDELLVK